MNLDTGMKIEPIKKEIVQLLVERGTESIIHEPQMTFIQFAHAHNKAFYAGPYKHWKDERNTMRLKKSGSGPDYHVTASQIKRQLIFCNK